MQCHWRWPAGGARGAREACGNEPMLRSRRARSLARPVAARTASARSAARPRDPSARSWAWARSGVRARDRGAVPLAVACEREGCSLGVRQRADAALAEGEIVGAACSGVRDCDEIDGEAA